MLEKILLFFSYSIYQQGLLFIVLFILGSVQQAKKENTRSRCQYMASLKVLHCSDGDTCSAKAPGKPHIKLRLIGLDAPEYKKKKKKQSQVFGKECTKRVNQLIKSKHQVLLCGRGYFGRYLALVFYKNKMINQQLIEEGFAFAYRHPRFKSKGWALESENRARRQAIGLWAHKAAQRPIQPTIFRKQIKQKRREP